MSIKSGIRAPSKKNISEAIQNAPTRNANGTTISRSSSASTLASVTEGKELSDAAKNSPAFVVGDRVWVNGTKPGYVQYIGETQFAPGIWAGVKLDECDGKNDGSVGGVRYFDCEPQRGIFIRPHRLTRQAGTPPNLSGDSLQVSPQDRNSGFIPGNKQGTSPRGLSSTPPKPCSKLKPGERVVVNSAGGVKMGILRYLGPADFAAGEWAGIELDEPQGKNDGSVGGKRYFECPMKHGLFAPVHKVSRAGGSSAVRSSHTGSLQSRSCSRESLNSSVSSVASSRAGRVKLGITSLSNNQKSQKGATTVLSPTQAALQETLKEKTEHIEQLLRERDQEKLEVAKAAVQLEEEKQKISSLQEEYKIYMQESEAKIQHLQKSYENAQLEVKNASSLLESEKRKIEDLQFRFEEEHIMKSELESQIEREQQKVKELENLFKCQGENEELINKLSHMESALRDKTDLVNKMENEIKDVELQLSARVAEVNHLSSALDAALQENQCLKSETEKIKELESKIGAMEENAKMLEVGRNDLILQVTSMKDVIKESELKYSEMQSKASSLEENLREKMNEISNLNCLIEAEKAARSDDSANLQLIHNLEMSQKVAQEKIASMTSEVNALSAELATKDNLYKESLTKLETTTKCLEENNNEVLRLNQLLTEVKKNYDDEVNANKSELQSLQEKMSVIETECAKHGAELSEKDVAFKEKLDGLNMQLKEHEDSKEKLEAQIANISNDLIEKEALINKLTNQLKEAKEEVHILSKDNSQSMTILQQKVTDMKEESERAQKEFTAALERISAEKEHLSQLLKDQEEQAHKSEALITDLKTALAQKENQVTEMGCKLQDVKSKMEDASQNSNIFQEQIVLLQTEKEQLIRQKEELSQSLLNLKEEISDCSSLLEDKSREAMQKQQEVQKLQAALSEKEDQITELGVLVENSQKQLEQLKQQNEKNMLLLESRVAEFKREQEKHQQGKEKILRDEIERIQGQLVEKENAFESSQAKILEIQTEIEHKEKEIQEMRQTLKDREDKLTSSLERERNSLSELESKMQFLKNHCEKLEKEKNEIAEQEKSAREARQILEKTKDTLMKDKMEQEALVKDRDTKLQMVQQEVERMRCEFIQHKDELQRKLDISEMELQAMKEFKTELEMQHGVLEELQQQLQESENDRCELQQQLNTALATVEGKTHLEKRISEIQEELEIATNRANEEAQKRQNLQNELQESQKLLKESNEKVEALKAAQIKAESHNQMSQDLQQVDQSAKISMSSSNEKSNSSNLADAETEDEKENLLSQINFLNSIIVDLQRKNEEMKLQQEGSSENVDTDINFNGVRQLPPRLFCDICDMFDLHDTEDCPAQSSFIEEVPHSRHHGNRHEERPYCNNCEIFGHWTLECDDQQTF